MRKFIVTILALSAMLSALVVAAQERPEDIWPKANDAYSLGEWKRALELYESIENKGVVSERLYYNMGNTHYKMGDNARAILYYERALKLNPANKDAENNIKIAQIHTLDKIEVLPEFVLVTWVRNMRDSLSSNSWAVAGLVLLVAVLVLLLLYRFAGSMGFRKFSFVAAIVTYALFLILNIVEIIISCLSAYGGRICLLLEYAQQCNRQQLCNSCERGKQYQEFSRCQWQQSLHSA